MRRHCGSVDVPVGFNKNEPGVAVLRSHAACTVWGLGRGAKLRDQCFGVAVGNFGEFDLPRAEPRVGAGELRVRIGPPRETRWTERAAALRGPRQDHSSRVAVHDVGAAGPSHLAPVSPRRVTRPAEQRLAWARRVRWPART